MDSSTFFGDEPATDPQQYDRYGRYVLNADGKGDKSYTRATTLAKTLDDGRGLAIWEQRKIAKGVAQSPGLVARAAVAALDDKATWREILAAADVKSDGDVKRDLGSAFHNLHERVHEMTDAEYAALPVELRVTYERYRAELDRLGITEVMTEGTCVNQQIGTAGKFDAVFRLADGRLVIGDRKTGRVTEYPHAPAVQFAIYANADVVITFDKNGVAHAEPMPDVDKRIALVVDITVGDETTAAVHVYEVDIWAGWYGALLAADVRRWRLRKDLVKPYHPELPPQPWDRNQPGAVSTPAEVLPENQAWFEQNTPGQQQPVEPADRPEANASPTAQAVLGTGPAIGTGNAIQPPHAEHPIGRPAFSSAEQKVIHLDSKGERVPDGIPVPAHPSGADVAQLDADVEELLRQYKTKANLQNVLGNIDPTANLARQRKNLAADIVSHPSWPTRRAEFLPSASGGVSPETPPPGRDEPESFSSVVTNAPGPVPPDPEPTNPYLAAAAPAPVKTPEDELAERIAAATSMQDLADVWEAARTMGLGWPPRLHQASEIKAKQLQQ